MKPSLAICVKRWSDSRFVVLEVGVTIEPLDIAFHKCGGFLKGHLSFADRPLRRRACPLDEIAAVVFNVGQDLGYGVTFDNMFEAIASIRTDTDVDRVGITEEVMEISESLLVRTHQKGTEIVGFVVGGMELDRAFHITEVDELVDFSVTVAGQVGEDP